MSDNSIGNVLLREANVGMNILNWGGRGSVATFFLCGCWVLLPPPNPDMSRGMLAAFLIMMALLFSVTVELLSIYLRWLDPFNKRTGRNARKELNGLARDMFSAIGMATSAMSKIRDAAGGGQGNHRKRRGVT